MIISEPQTIGHFLKKIMGNASRQLPWNLLEQKPSSLFCQLFNCLKLLHPFLYFFVIPNFSFLALELVPSSSIISRKFFKTFPMTFSTQRSNFLVRFIEFKEISKMYVTKYVNTHGNALDFELERKIRNIKMQVTHEVWIKFDQSDVLFNT